MNRNQRRMALSLKRSGGQPHRAAGQHLYFQEDQNDLQPAGGHRGERFHRDQLAGVGERLESDRRGHL